MSWIQKLHETYQSCAGKEPPGSDRLMPTAHTKQQAHIEIVIDDRGNFRRAAVLHKEETLLPATEKSAGRTSAGAPHPLCDKIQYCAADYKERGGRKEPFFEAYARQLDQWCQSPFRHRKAIAILKYVQKKTVVADLVASKILMADNRKLAVLEKGRGSAPVKQIEEQFPIFKVLTPKKEGQKSVIDPGDAFIRWRVESAGEVRTGTWEDESLILNWQQFEAAERASKGFCMVTGAESALAEQHPAKLRHGADKAKLISSNDKDGFTFRGRFLDARQAAGVAFEVTQKAHNALRWLIGRKQAYRSGDQVFVSWAVGGQPVPDPWGSSRDLFGAEEPKAEAGAKTKEAPGDVGQAFSRRLKRAIAGYRAALEDTDEIVVLGLDSATPGRMAMTFYRELKGSDFLRCILDWHEGTAWLQNFGKDSQFVGAPSLRDAAEATYGRRDDKLLKATVERLLPCVVDGMPVPRDLLDSCVRRASRRQGLEPWEWEKCLGVACALYRRFHAGRSYRMSLEEDRRTRDYLYGRMLAVAENIEKLALYVAGESRDTTAARLMQRFADRPYSTWRTIELALGPYKSRLRGSRGGFLWKMEQLLDGLIQSFPRDGNSSFMNDSPLSGEFLLGYHCQRQKLREPSESKDAADSVEISK